MPRMSCSHLELFLNSFGFFFHFHTATAAYTAVENTGWRAERAFWGRGKKKNLCNCPLCTGRCWKWRAEEKTTPGVWSLVSNIPLRRVWAGKVFSSVFIHPACQTTKVTWSAPFWGSLGSETAKSKHTLVGALEREADKTARESPWISSLHIHSLVLFIRRGVSLLLPALTF